RLQSVSESENNREDHRRRANDRGADENGLGGRLEGVASSIILLQQMLRALEPRIVSVVLLELLVNSWDLFDEGQLEDRLRVVRNRAIRVDRDRHRSHSQESERDETKR